MRTRLALVAPLFALVPSLASFTVGCGSAPSGGGSGENAGTAAVAITQVPTDVTCIEVDVTGLNFVAQRFAVKAGQSSVLNVTGLPIGSVDIAGTAWSGPCTSVGATATWSAQSVPATIAKGAPASVTLEFFPAAQAQVGADFQNETYRTTSTFAGTALQAGPTDGVGIAARFNRPQQIANDGTNLYVADGKNLTVRQIAIATAAVTTIAGNPAATGNGVDGVGAAATFNHPEGVTVDGGNLYVTDSTDNTVRKIVLATKAVSTIAGTPGTAGSADGIGAAAQFNFPYGIAADGHGNLFVADSGNATIRQIVIATGAVTTLSGTALQTGWVDGIASVARFNGPGGIASDGSSLYVSDGTTVRQVLVPSGRVFTLAGDPTLAGAADGFNARFSNPTGIAFDAFGGNLFITDAGNRNIRQLSFNTGLVTTVAGSPSNFGAIDGNGLAASFRLPLGVTVDPKGILYVSDTANHTIRKM